MSTNIVLAILPPHSSCLTQPLDVGVFGPLKKVMASKIEPLIRTGISRVQKVEWLAAFGVAHNDTFSKRNIKGAWHGTGIYPFLPSKVLNRVAKLTLETSQTHALTPSEPITLYPDSVLISSSVNFNDVRTASTALSIELQSEQPISARGQNYASCVLRSLERLHAKNTILTHRTKDLENVISQRK